MTPSSLGLIFFTYIAIFCIADIHAVYRYRREDGCTHIYRIELNMILEKSLGRIEIFSAIYP